MPRVTPQVLRAVVTSGLVLASAIVWVVPVGREMVVFSLKP